MIQEVPRLELSNGAVRFHSRCLSAALRVVDAAAKAVLACCQRTRSRSDEVGMVGDVPLAVKNLLDRDGTPDEEG